MDGHVKPISLMMRFTPLALALAATVADAQDWSLGFSADLTSNYIAKGQTQTDDNPALQLGIVVGYGGGYLGLWTSNVAFDGDKDTELDVTLGYGWDYQSLTFDVGFAQYLYWDDDEDYGEAFVLVGYDVPNALWLGAEYYREVYSDTDWFYGGFQYAGLPWNLALSGGAGSDFGTKDLDETLVEADLGVTWGFHDNAALDLRANYSSVEDTRGIVTLSWAY
jgi:hypothetical protein